MSASATSTLADTLSRLRDLAPEERHSTIDGWRERLTARRLRVLVAGEAKRGKSTVVNALLGIDVLPTGVVPVTALPTTIMAGETPGVDVTYLDGRTERWPLDALADAVTEQRNPGNRRRIADVIVHVDAPLLGEGVEIVDTPGTGSVYGHNTSAAEQALPTLDAAVFVLTVDPPVSAAELELLRRVHEHAVALFVVLNKGDRLDEDEQRQAVEFSEDVLSDAIGESVPIRVISARDRDGGFTAFADAFVEYLRTSGGDDLTRALARHARTLTEQLIDEVELTLAAADERREWASEEVAAFSGRLADVEDARAEAEDLVHGQAKRLRQELDEAAEAAGGELHRQVGHDLDVFLHGSTGDAPALTRDGREYLVRATTDAVERWRTDQAGRLRAGLEAADERVRGRLSELLADLRKAAEELLGVRLTLPASDVELVESRRFFYVTHETIDTAELIAGLVRRHLPGELGRRKAAARLRSEAGSFVPQQVGRARADLQARLDETTRQLTRAVARRYDDATGHLRRALDAASRLGEVSGAEAERIRRGLADRRDALEALRAELATESRGHPHRSQGSGQGGDDGEDGDERDQHVRHVGVQASGLQPFDSAD